MFSLKLDGNEVTGLVAITLSLAHGSGLWCDALGCDNERPKRYSFKDELRACSKIVITYSHKRSQRDARCVNVVMSELDAIVKAGIQRQHDIRSVSSNGLTVGTIEVAVNGHKKVLAQLEDFSYANVMIVTAEVEESATVVAHGYKSEGDIAHVWLNEKLTQDSLISLAFS